MKKAVTSKRRGSKKKKAKSGKWYVVRYVFTDELVSMPHETPDAALAEAMASGYQRYRRNFHGALVEALIVETIS